MPRAHRGGTTPKKAGASRTIRPESSRLPDQGIIEEFGLPSWFPDEEVPLAVARFCSDTDHKPLAYALGLADERGFEPVCRPVPHIGPGLVVIGLSVGGKQVPLMAKVGKG